MAVVEVEVDGAGVAGLGEVFLLELALAFGLDLVDYLVAEAFDH